MSQMKRDKEIRPTKLGKRKRLSLRSRTQNKGNACNILIVTEKGEELTYRMTRISEYIKSEMYDYFTSLPSDAEQRAFVKKVMHDDPDECTELLDKVTYVDEFETVLDNRKDIWVDSMKIYLDSCVKTVYLSQIRVSASQRGRAIDIYENLNMGGVSLNTFDLIMARVAKVDKKNFLQRIKESIESTKTYPNSVLESSIKTILSSALTNKTYNAIYGLNYLTVYRK